MRNLANYISTFLIVVQWTVERLAAKCRKASRSISNTEPIEQRKMSTTQNFLHFIRPIFHLRNLHFWK